MKIAVTLSGHIRTGLELFPNFKKVIIDQLHPDIYIHLWDEEEIFNPKKIHCEAFSKKIGNSKINNKCFDNIKKLYAPKLILIENNDKFKRILVQKTKYTNEIIEKISKNILPPNNFNILNMLSQFYSTKIIIDSVIRSGIPYDLIIRCRFDGYYTRNIHQNDLEFAKNSLVIPKELDFCGGINDRFAIGTIDHLKIYGSRFDFVYEYCINENKQFHPESILTYLLELNKIEPIRVPPLCSTIRKIIGDDLLTCRGQIIKFDIR